MLKFRKIFLSLFIILNLICVSVFAVTESEFETSFETWASDKTLMTYVLDNEIKSTVDAYVNTNYSGYDYMYCGCAHSGFGNYVSTYILIILSNDGAKIDTLSSASDYYTINFDKNITALTVFVRDNDKSTIRSSSEGLQGSMSSITLYVQAKGTSYTRLQSDKTLENTFFNYSSFLESSTPTPEPEPDEPTTPSDFDDLISDVGSLSGVLTTGIYNIFSNTNIQFIVIFFGCILLIAFTIYIVKSFIGGVKK